MDFEKYLLASIDKNGYRLSYLKCIQNRYDRYDQFCMCS